jgi:tRNA(Ile)-lysidine synthase
MLELQPRVLENLRALVPNAKKFVVAVSGGADSIALLRLMQESPYECEVAHFDHALRETSNADTEFVKTLCEKLSLSFHTERADVAKIAKEKKWNLEDAARRLRYSFLTRVAKQVKADVILTAHTQDDQAETVLMQLFRGAAHLTGMREVQGNVIRPLLRVSKKELLEYLVSLNQDYRTDESNFDTTRTRAWLRQDILPKLETRYPHIKQTLVQLARLQRDNETYLEQQSRTRGLTHLFPDKHIDLDLLRRAHPSLQRQAVVMLLETANAPVTKDALERILELLTETETVQVSLSPQQSAVLSAGTLRVIQKGETPKLVQPDNETDKMFMKQALKLAAKAAKQGELPVGCVIVKDNQIIAEAHNETETQPPTPKSWRCAVLLKNLVIGGLKIAHST